MIHTEYKTIYKPVTVRNDAIGYSNTRVVTSFCCRNLIELFQYHSHLNVHTTAFNLFIERTRIWLYHLLPLSTRPGKQASVRRCALSWRPTDALPAAAAHIDTQSNVSRRWRLWQRRISHGSWSVIFFGFKCF